MSKNVNITFNARLANGAGDLFAKGRRTRDLITNPALGLVHNAHRGSTLFLAEVQPLPPTGRRSLRHPLKTTCVCALRQEPAKRFRPTTSTNNKTKKRAKLFDLLFQRNRNCVQFIYFIYFQIPGRRFFFFFVTCVS